MEPETPRLLLLCDAFVHRDRAQSGLSGKIAIGVRGAEGDLWWTAELQHGHAARTRFAPEPERDVDAALLLDAEAAELAVAGKTAGSPGARVYGDTALLGRFLDRYLKKQNIVDLRAKNGR